MTQQLGQASRGIIFELVMEEARLFRLEKTMIIMSRYSNQCSPKSHPIQR